MLGIGVCWCMRQTRRSIKRKITWNQLQLEELSSPAGCSLWPVWVPSGKCPMQRDGQGTEVRIWEQFSRWRWRASVHKGRSEWDLKTLKFTRLGVQKAPVYLFNKLPVYRAIYLLLYFPCTFGDVNGKRIIFASQVLAYFFIYLFYCCWQVSRWHCSDFPTIPIWLLSHNWGQTMQLQRLSCGS